MLTLLLAFALTTAQAPELKISAAPITFETGKDALAKSSEPALAEIAKTLADKTYISTLRIEVHSDADAEQKLTEQRALAVTKALVAHGVECKRLVAVGFGATKPVADNSTADGKAQNRRVTLVIAGLRDKAVGGLPLDGGGKVAGDACAK